MDSFFKIKDLGELIYFWGIEIARSKQGIYISQRKYILDLLESTGYLGGKQVQTPMVKGAMKDFTGSTPYKDPSGYRCLVGKLLYLNTTRPDIIFAVQQLSQYMATRKTHHYSAAFAF
jgi:hypothetical protein